MNPTHYVFPCRHPLRLPGPCSSPLFPSNPMSGFPAFSILRTEEEEEEEEGWIGGGETHHTQNPEKTSFRGLWIHSLLLTAQYGSSGAERKKEKKRYTFRRREKTGSGGFFFQIFPFSQKAKRKSTLLDIDQGSFFSFFQATQKIQFPLLSIQFVSFHSGLLLFFPRILFLLPRSCLETRKKELLFLSFSLPYASILSAFKGKYHFFPAWYFLLYIVFDIVGKTWFF